MNTMIVEPADRERFAARLEQAAREIRAVGMTGGWHANACDDRVETENTAEHASRNATNDTKMFASLTVSRGMYIPLEVLR